MARSLFFSTTSSSAQQAPIRCRSDGAAKAKSGNTVLAFVVCCCFLLFSSAASVASAATADENVKGAAKKTNEAQHKDFTVFGYLPEYRLGGFNYAAAFQNGLTHLIFFSLEVDPVTHVPTALDRLPSKEQAAEARKAADKYGGKILLGFGGNSRSNGFAQMVETEGRRLKFLQALNDLLREYDFDGVDYNWEYPSNAREWRLWGILMSESKLYLRNERDTDGLSDEEASVKTKKANSDADGSTTRRKITHNIVTFTMYQDPNHAHIIRQFDLLKDADYVHCMSYDQRGQHSTLDFGREGITMGLQQLGGGAKTAKQFTLGLPFYARHVETGEPKTYAELAQSVKSNKVNQVGKYFFNSQQLLYTKTMMAMEAGLGGVMIWELGQDVQPLTSRKSLMWGIHEATSGMKQHEIRKMWEKETSTSSDAAADVKKDQEAASEL